MSTGCCSILASQIKSNVLLLNNKKKEVTQLKSEILKLTMESCNLHGKLLKLIEVDKPMVKLSDNLANTSITEDDMAKYQTIVNLSVNQYALKKLEQAGCEKLMVAMDDLAKLEHEAAQLETMQRVI